MTAQLDSTVALVTGASSGIGEATARALAAQGSAVALVARRKDRLDALATDITGAGGRALVVEADVTDRDQAIGAVKRTVDELGRLDTVINNAGVMLLGPIVDAPVDEWDRMVAVNIQGLLYVAHAALPHLLEAADSGERRVADLVNISSVAGRVARSGSGVYNLTKHGVGAFSESLRQEVTGRHVRVSSSSPAPWPPSSPPIWGPPGRRSSGSGSTPSRSCRRPTSPTPSGTSSPDPATSPSTRCSSVPPNRRAER